MATNQKTRYTFQDAINRRTLKSYILDVIDASPSSSSTGDFLLPIWDGLEQEFQQDILRPTSSTSFLNFVKLVESYECQWWTRAWKQQQAEKLAIKQAEKLAIEQAKARQEKFAIERTSQQQQAKQQDLLKKQQLKQRAEKAKQRFLAEINQMQADFRFQHPYECKRCPERFSSNTKLHRHIDTSHAKKPTETTSAALPSSGISISSPSSSPVPSTGTPALFAETQASFQTLPTEILARSPHESCSNSSLSPVTPYQTLPAALHSQAPSIETPLTPPPSPSVTHRELSPSSPPTLSTTAGIIENPYQESPVSPRSPLTPSPRSTSSSPQSPLLSPRTAKAIKNASKNAIEKAPTNSPVLASFTAQLPATRPSSAVIGSKQYENAIERAQAAAAPPPTPRHSSPVFGSKQHENVIEKA